MGKIKANIGKNSSENNLIQVEIRVEGPKRGSNNGINAIFKLQKNDFSLKKCIIAHHVQPQARILIIVVANKTCK